MAPAASQPVLAMITPLACSMVAVESMACSRFSLSVRASQYACALTSRNAAWEANALATSISPPSKARSRSAYMFNAPIGPS